MVGGIFSSPAVDSNGVVYFMGYNDSNLYAVDGNDGSLRWVCHFDSGGWGLASPVIASGGIVYQVLLFDPNLYAIDSNDGVIVWSLELGEITTLKDADSFSEAAVGPDGTIYVNFDDPNLWAVDPNGNIKWDRRLGMIGSFTVTVGSDGLVYAAGDDGWLLVYDSNGFELSRFEGEVGLNYPAITSDGTVIVSDANKVWAVGGQGCEGQRYALHWPEDLYGDLAFDSLDYALLAADWLGCTDIESPCSYTGERVYLSGDLDRDYFVDFSDVKMFADMWLVTE